MAAVARRPASSHLVFRQRVHRDLVDKVRGRVLLIDMPAVGTESDISVAVKAGDTLKISLRTRDPDVAKARQGAVVAHLSKLWASIRQGPSSLSDKRLIALAGDVDRHLVDAFGDGPGDADSWSAIKGWSRAVAEGRVSAPPSLAIDPHGANEVSLAREVFGLDLTAGIDARDRS